MTQANTAIITTKAKDAEKVNQVFGWILNGASDYEIQQAIETTWPGEATKPLVVAALKRIEKAAEPDPRIVRGWCIEATRAVYAKAIEANDFSAALRALKQLEELAGKQ